MTTALMLLVLAQVAPRAPAPTPPPAPAHAPARLMVLAQSAPQAPAPPRPPAPGPLAPGQALPGGRVVTGQAAVVAGDEVSARSRALDDGLRQVVDGAVGEILDPAARAASDKALRSVLAHPRPYVRRYRVLEQGAAPDGYYRLQIEAELDLALLRRDVERATAAKAANVAAPAAAPADLRLEVVGPAEAPAALVLALGAAGVKASLGKAAPAGSSPIRVTASETDEGPVRGTGKSAASCRYDVVPPPGAPAGRTSVSASAYGFAGAAPAARADCFARAAAAVAARLGPALLPAPSPAAGRALTLDVDLVEPPALAVLLKVLRGLGSVSAADVRRIAAGHAELRVTTRLAPEALLAAAVRDAAGTLALTEVAFLGDQVKVKTRLASPSPAAMAPAPGSSLPPAVAPVPPAVPPPAPAQTVPGARR